MSETDDAELFAAIESAGDLRGTLRWLSFLFQNDFDLYRVYHRDREIADRDSAFPPPATSLSPCVTFIVAIRVIWIVHNDGTLHFLYYIFSYIFFFFSFFKDNLMKITRRVTRREGLISLRLTRDYII